MRLFIAAALFLVVISCASKEEKEEKMRTVSDQIRVSFDTVLVDSGDEFLYLHDQLRNSDLSSDKNFLFNFNLRDLTIEKIDLNQLKLEEIIKYEKEGPNGLGASFPSFKVLSDQNLLFWTYRFYKIFGQNGLLNRDLELDKIASEYFAGNEYYAASLFVGESNPNRVLELIYHRESGKNFILDFDLASQTFKKIDLPELDKNLDYKVELFSGGRSAGGYGGAVISFQINDKIIFSTNTFNEVQVFDLTTDSLYLKKWDTPLLGYRRAYLPPKSVEQSSGEFSEIVRKSDEDISFMSLVWDEKNERYFRFSQKRQFAEEQTDYGRYIPTGADVFLSVFDENLDLLAESQIPELTQPPNIHFAKDGNIWMFENVNDELAFVIMKIEDL
ncbi:DUF4221 family protein [Algoriphagus aquimarinus]|uniref:DUF4221 family protein n=1 Tax=Algoriphagus aquimarinus TaxID=237018 RepID=UPI0030D748C0|tara:strand:+ start:77049 stop:78209 length:1161 start_codon:yes stop_codon:yes gene_type:complete